MNSAAKMKTINKVNVELASDKIEIRPYRSKKRFANANYLVVLKSGSTRTMPDGTHWDGTEHVGHYQFITDAVAAARETAKLRS